MNDILLKFNTESYSLYNSSDFIVENIENLSWAQNTLSTTSSPFLAGDTVQNNVGMPRDITITLKPTEDKGNYGGLVHKFARMQGKTVQLVWKNREMKSFTYDFNEAHIPANEYPPLVSDLMIEGVVNEFDTPRFENKVGVVFNIHCSNPYWQTLNPIYINTNTDPNHMTAACNYSEVKTGYQIFIPNFYIDNINEYYEFWINGSGTADEKANYDLRIYPKYIPASGDISGAMGIITMEKGNVSIRLAETNTEEGRKYAADITDKVSWKMFRDKKTAPSTYQRYETIEFPYFPVSTKNEPILLEAVFVDSLGTHHIGTQISYNPKFI